MLLRTARHKQQRPLPALLHQRTLRVQQNYHILPVTQRPQHIIDNKLLQELIHRPLIGNAA